MLKKCGGFVLHIAVMYRNLRSCIATCGHASQPAVMYRHMRSCIATCGYVSKLTYMFAFRLLGVACGMHTRAELRGSWVGFGQTRVATRFGLRAGPCGLRAAGCRGCGIFGAGWGGCLVGLVGSALGVVGCGLRRPRIGDLVGDGCIRPRGCDIERCNNRTTDRKSNRTNL
jgi:hypothetical protein